MYDKIHDTSKKLVTSKKLHKDVKHGVNSEVDHSNCTKKCNGS